MDAARSIARSGGAQQVRALAPTDASPVHDQGNPIAALGEQDKVALLERADQAARRIDNRVQEVNVRLALSFETMLVMATTALGGGHAAPGAARRIGHRRRRAAAGAGLLGCRRAPPAVVIQPPMAGGPRQGGGALRLG